MQILSPENILLLEEIVSSENWTSSPSLEEFNQAITSLKNNSEEPYKEVLDKFVVEATKLPYSKIAQIIDNIICEY